MVDWNPLSRSPKTMRPRESRSIEVLPQPRVVFGPVDGHITTAHRHLRPVTGHAWQEPMPPSHLVVLQLHS